MKIDEKYVNATKGHHIGESGLYEPFTDDIGDLFKALVREHGRCVSKVYVDRDGKAIPVGWVFHKRRAYDDSPRETFLCETWVTLHAEAPTVTRREHLFNLDERKVIE